MAINDTKQFLEELFFESVECGNMAGIEKAMREGVDPHINDDWAICLAAKHGQLEVVKFLISHDLDICNRHNSPLRNAAENEHREVLKLLLKHGADDTALAEHFQWKYADEILGEGTLEKALGSVSGEFIKSHFEPKKTNDNTTSIIANKKGKHTTVRNYINRRNRKLFR